MQKLEAAVAVFCTACICAELLVQLCGSGWAAGCIKTIAGLYILVAALQATPQIGKELCSISIPQAEPVSMGTWTDAVLTEASQTLAQTLEAKCQEEVGIDVQLTITLEETNAGVSAASITGTLPGDCSDAQRQTLERILTENLGIKPQWKVEEHQP